MSSLTGVSSGKLTSMTWQRTGSRSSSTTSWAWLRSGPPLAASMSPRALVRNVTAWPAAGASRTMRSNVPERSSCFTLPSTRTSRMPGMAVATTSSTPVDTRRFATRRNPWSSRYSTSASVGREHPPRHTAAPGRLVEQRLLVGEGGFPPEQDRQPAGIVELDHEHRETYVGSHSGERGSDSRLAHASLAGDHHDVALPAERLAIHPGRHYRRAPCGFSSARESQEPLVRTVGAAVAS